MKRFDESLQKTASLPKSQHALHMRCATAVDVGDDLLNEYIGSFQCGFKELA